MPEPTTATGKQSAWIVGGDERLCVVEIAAQETFGGGQLIGRQPLQDLLIAIEVGLV